MKWMLFELDVVGVCLFLFLSFLFLSFFFFVLSFSEKGGVEGADFTKQLFTTRCGCDAAKVSARCPSLPPAWCSTSRTGLGWMKSASRTTQESLE